MLLLEFGFESGDPIGKYSRLFMHSNGYLVAMGEAKDMVIPKVNYQECQ